MRVEKVQDARKGTLVLDKLSTHATHSQDILREHLGKELGDTVWDRSEIHHTPVHASWLNQAEVAIGMYSRQSLDDGRVGDLSALAKTTAPVTR
jgi:hypothetical protein